MESLVLEKEIYKSCMLMCPCIDCVALSSLATCNCKALFPSGGNNIKKRPLKLQDLHSHALEPFLPSSWDVRSSSIKGC